MGSDPALEPPPGLVLAGACHQDGSSIALIAPAGASFWHIFAVSPEYADGRSDPMDRWSRRVIGAWADKLGAEAIFPSDGPPYPPFLSWALASGRCWTSPVGMLVHDQAGLMISFRGALRLRLLLSLPSAASSPCEDCSRPCLGACPAGAFAMPYDPAICHAWLDRPEGQDCMSGGCLVRRACPISAGCGRLPQQSAWHMRQFHP